jgi:hypothetical protein
MIMQLTTLAWALLVIWSIVTSGIALVITFAALDMGELNFKELFTIAGAYSGATVLIWAVWAIYPYTAMVLG